MANNYPFVLNGISYVEAAFLNFGYTAALPAALSDLVHEALLLHTTTSSSSNTISTGSKVFTVTAGLAIQTDDKLYIASTAAPQTNRMFGKVTAYNFATGSLTVNVLGTSGSGTLSSWLIGLGGMGPTQVGDYLVALDQGGLGFNATNTLAMQGSFIGLGDPGCHMAEIREEFAGSQGEFTSIGTSGVVTSPWAMTLSGYNVYANGPGNINTQGFFFLSAFDPSGLNIRVTSNVLTYGNSGFLHLGRGGLTYETYVYGVGATANYCARIGLRANGSSAVSRIFDGGGIGFEANSQANGGFYVLVGGTAGNITRLNTAVKPSAVGDKLRMVVDHDGTIVEFFINGNFVGSITDNLPCAGIPNLVQPAYESAMLGSLLAGVTNTSFYIDALLIRKFLTR